MKEIYLKESKGKYKILKDREWRKKEEKIRKIIIRI